MNFVSYTDLPVLKTLRGSYNPIDWAKEHCESFITTGAIQLNGIYYYRFYFGNETDRLMFMLKWL